MKKIVFSVVFLLLIASLNSQDYRNDSIYKLYKQSKGRERVEAIYSLTKALNIPLPLLDKLSKEALILSSSMDDEAQQMAFYSRGYYFISISKKDSAYHYYLKTVDFPVNKSNMLLFAKSYSSLSHLQMLKKNFTEGKKWNQKMFKLVLKYNSPELEAYYYLSLGRNESIQGFYREGIDYYKQAVEIFKEENNYEKSGFCYIQLADLHSNIQQYAEATKYISLAVEIENHFSIKFKSALYYLMARLFFLQDNHIQSEKEMLLQSLKYAKYLESKYLTSRIYTGLSIYHARNGAMDSAIYYNEISINEAHEIEDVDGLLTGYQNAVQMYSNKNNLVMAKKYIDSSYSVINKTNKKYKLAFLYQMAGNIFLQRKEYATARAYIDSLNSLDEEIRPITKLSVYKFKTAYYTAVNDLKNALIFEKMHSNINDSILRTNYKETIEEIYAKFKIKEKEKENIRLKKDLKLEKKNARLSFYAWLGTLFVLVILIVLFISFRRNVRIRRKLRNEKILKIEKEKQLIKEHNKVLILEEENIKHKLEITNNSLYQQNQHTEELLNTIKTLKPYTNQEGKRKIRELLINVNNLSETNNWHTFERNFSSIYPTFLEEIKRRHPDLTTGEIRLCAFIKMKLNTAEILAITIKSKNSIYSAKKRLRQKLNFEDSESLEHYIQSIT
jgi:hypothetical protein